MKGAPRLAAAFSFAIVDAAKYTRWVGYSLHCRVVDMTRIISVSGVLASLLVCFMGACSGDGAQANIDFDMVGALPDALEDAVDVAVEPDLETPPDGKKEDLPTDFTTDLGPQLPMGTLCNSNSVCASNLCVDFASGAKCTAPCIDNTVCIVEWGCAPASDLVEGTPDSICAPVDDYSCLPCKESVECADPAFSLASCVDQGPDGLFCGNPCSQAGDCKGNQTCRSGVNAEGDSGAWCQPMVGLTCACPPLGFDEISETTCYHENVQGICLGTRRCDLQGLTDCDAIEPQAEVCNGEDDNCDGLTDEGFGTASCGQGECVHTVDRCVDGNLVECDPMEGSMEELCDGLDNDCNGFVDEDFPDLDEDGTPDCMEEDIDGDGILDGEDNCPLSFNPDQTNTDEDAQGNVCDDDDDNDGSLDNEDCAPTNPAIFPGNPEVCDNKDNDCNGQIDESLGQTTCGQGPCEHTISNCAYGITQTCDPQQGASPEVCDGEDNDCNGITDEGLGETVCGVGPCEHTQQNCVNGVPKSCDPLLGALVEVCDGQDNDCDGVADNGVSEPNGCSDNNPCTSGDACIDSVCQGTAYVCNDGNPCTADSCNGDGTCTFAPDAVGCADVGCSDGTREGWVNAANYPTVAGCAGTWSNTNLRAQRTNTICGSGTACPVAEDLCGAGWHICMKNGQPSDLSSRLSASQCDGGPNGAFLVASSRCTGWSFLGGCEYDTPYGCGGGNGCDQAICCGQDCSKPTCDDAVWNNNTVRFDVNHGCGDISPNNESGVSGILCCRDS